MAANDALIASLLLGQRQRRDPLEIYQSFGKGQLQAGSSAAPLGSGNPLEGIARALQGGLGGLVQGYAAGKQEDQDASNLSALTRASTEKSSEGIAKALSGIKGNSELMIPMLGQIIQGRLNDTLAQEQAGKKMGVFGVGAAPGAPATLQSDPMQQGGGAAQPLPQGGGGGIPQPGYSLANNSGNIRASSIPWEGKGQPQNGFETFDTPQSGANAHFKNFAAYVQANPNITVAQAIAKWSPSNENDTQGVIKTITEATGINPGMPMGEVLKDPAMAAQLLDAQTRLEKGGMPPGYSADTFTAAAGGQQATPGGIPPGTIAQPPQIAQGSGPTAMNQGPPVAARSSPAGDELRRTAQAAIQAGDNVTAQKYAQAAIEEDAKWAAKVGEKNIDQSYEDTKYQRAKADEDARHQRGLQEKKDNPTYTQEQNLAHTYATRLNNAIPQLEALIADPKNIPSWGEQSKANSSYYPEPLVSDKAKEFRRVVKDVMSATLRRESGASIADSEYATESQKFIPQPGDPPNVVANKIAALKQAARSIAEGTGRPVGSYSFFGGAPAAGATPVPSQGGGIPAPPPGFRPLP